nr:uncharacterized protein LOC109159553 [Ipomoea batatas]
MQRTDFEDDDPVVLLTKHFNKILKQTREKTSGKDLAADPEAEDEDVTDLEGCDYNSAEDLETPVFYYEIEYKKLYPKWECLLKSNRSLGSLGWQCAPSPSEMGTGIGENFGDWGRGWGI